MTIKIFKMNDVVDWVAASTLEEAVAFYTEEFDGELDEGAEPRELTGEEMDRFQHLGEDGVRAKWPKDKVPTFRQELADDIASGGRFPCLFASTEY